MPCLRLHMSFVVNYVDFFQFTVSSVSEDYVFLIDGQGD